MPISKASVAAAEKTDIAKDVKDDIDRFTEGIPILMNALDELTALHPFIGGALIRQYVFLRIKRGSSCCIGVQDGVHPGAKASRQ
jgi:hypothetical protein